MFRRLTISFVKRASGIFFSNIFATILGIGAGIIIARQLGPEKRGNFGLVFLATSLIFSFGHLGLGSSIAYFTGKKSISRQKILTFIVTCSLVLGTIMPTIFIFIYPHIKGIWTEIPRSVMLIGMIAVPFMFLHNFITRFLLGALKVKQHNMTNIFKSLFYLILIIILVWIFKGGVKETVISFTASTIIASILGLLLFTRESWPMKKISLSMAGPFFRYGIKSYAILIFTILNIKLDIFLVKYFLSASEVGYYQIAANIAQRFWYMPDALSAMLFPTLIAMDKESSKFSAKVCRHNLFIMVLISILIIFIARPVIIFMYGKEYEAVIYALYSILWGVTIFPIYKFLSVDFASKKQLGIGIFASFIGILVNVAGNLYLIPKYGIIGAGIATSISYSVLSIILIIFFRIHTKIPLKEILILNREDLTTYIRGIRKILSRVRREKKNNL